MYVCVTLLWLLRVNRLTAADVTVQIRASSGGQCSCGAGEQAGAEEEEEVSSEAPQVGVQVTTCMSM